MLKIIPGQKGNIPGYLLLDCRQKHMIISTHPTVKSIMGNLWNLCDSNTTFPRLNEETTNLTAWQTMWKEWSENQKMFTAGPIIRYFVEIQTWCHIWFPHWERNICKCLYYFGSATSHVFFVINEWFLWDWIKLFIFHDYLPNSHVLWLPCNSTQPAAGMECNQPGLVFIWPVTCTNKRIWTAFCQQTSDVCTYFGFGPCIALPGSIGSIPSLSVTLFWPHVLILLTYPLSWWQDKCGGVCRIMVWTMAVSLRCPAKKAGAYHMILQ